MNVAEAASIAAITQYPSKYDPLNEPENNRKRQIDVLYAMKDEDLKYLTEDEYQQAKAYEMVFTNSKNYKARRLRVTTANQRKQHYRLLYRLCNHNCSRGFAENGLHK